MVTQDNSFGGETTAPGIDTGGTLDTVASRSADGAHAFGAKVQEVGDQARAAFGELKTQAHDKVEDFRDQAMRLKDQALGQARTAAEDGKARAADTIHDVAGNLRQAAGSLSQNQTIAPVGKYANQAADALENFAGTLRNKDVDQLVTEVSGYVRRNPAIAIGIAVAAGFALTQLLSGGSTRSAGNYDDDRYA